MDKFTQALLTADETPGKTWYKEKYFLNRKTGDILITFNKEDAPQGKWWVQISKNCYLVLTDNH